MGWVANHVDGRILAQADNIAYLRHQLATRYGAPLLANLQSAVFYPPNWLGLMPGVLTSGSSAS